MAALFRFIDRAIAGMLALRSVLLGLLWLICGLSLFFAGGAEDEFLREWLLELFGATLLFVCLLHVNPHRASVNVVGALSCAATFLVVLSFLCRHVEFWNVVSIKVAASLVLFILLESVVKRALDYTRVRQEQLIARVTAARQTLKDEAFTLIKSKVPTIDLGIEEGLENYGENLADMVFGTDFRPGIQQAVRDDPEWEALWSARAAAPDDKGLAK
jgi:hypothetical protein